MTRKSSSASKAVTKTKAPPGPTAPTAQPKDESFDAIVRLIDAARQRAYQAVNTTMIELYWKIGQHISRKLAAAEWGDGVVDRLAAHIARTEPGQRGFTRRNLFRMRQFYGTYQLAERVPPLVAPPDSTSAALRRRIQSKVNQFQVNRAFKARAMLRPTGPQTTSMWPDPSRLRVRVNLATAPGMRCRGAGAT